MEPKPDETRQRGTARQQCDRPSGPPVPASAGVPGTSVSRDTADDTFLPKPAPENGTSFTTPTPAVRRASRVAQLGTGAVTACI